MMVTIKVYESECYIVKIYKFKQGCAPGAGSAFAYNINTK